MTGWRVHAWVLLSNHYHLFVETPEANLVAGMQWLQNAYTRRFNTRHRKTGRLFGDRYKSVLVEGTAGYYFETLLDYIHLNPVRAGLVRPSRGQDILDYPWSSVAGGYALLPQRRPKWLAASAGLDAFGCADSSRGRREFVGRLNERMREETTKECGVAVRDADADGRESHLRRGWYWGSPAFAEKALKMGNKALVRIRSRTVAGRREKKAHDRLRAEELLESGLRAAGLKRAAVLELPGADPRKVAIARVIWSQTTVRQSWLAERLGMKSAANVSQLIRRANLGQIPTDLPRELRQWADRESKNAA
jgi:hypothetical protein